MLIHPVERRGLDRSRRTGRLEFLGAVFGTAIYLTTTKKTRKRLRDNDDMYNCSKVALLNEAGHDRNHANGVYGVWPSCIRAVFTLVLYGIRFTNLLLFVKTRSLRHSLTRKCSTVVGGRVSSGGWAEDWGCGIARLDQHRPNCLIYDLNHHRLRQNMETVRTEVRSHPIFRCWEVWRKMVITGQMGWRTDMKRRTTGFSS
jgi:hypothetical protein